jgi:4-amino-4-deoxy-L-arabinose transferase-like glycosyltransferase
MEKNNLHGQGWLGMVGGNNPTRSASWLFYTMTLFVVGSLLPFLALIFIQDFSLVINISSFFQTLCFASPTSASIFEPRPTTTSRSLPDKHICNQNTS